MAIRTTDRPTDTAVAALKSVLVKLTAPEISMEFGLPPPPPELEVACRSQQPGERGRERERAENSFARGMGISA